MLEYAYYPTGSYPTGGQIIAEGRRSRPWILGYWERDARKGHCKASKVRCLDCEFPECLEKIKDDERLRKYASNRESRGKA